MPNFEFYEDLILFIRETLVFFVLFCKYFLEIPRIHLISRTLLHSVREEDLRQELGLIFLKMIKRVNDTPYGSVSLLIRH